MDITTNLPTEVAKKILGNRENAITFLFELQKVKGLDLPIKIRKSGINKGKEILSLGTQEIWLKIAEHWDYEIGKQIIRTLFRTTNKYKSGVKAYKTMNVLFEEWNRLNFGEIKWSVSQGEFDRFVQGVNAKKSSRTSKDKEVKLAAVKYRRIKEINTVRHDFIENLIFEKNENIIPTLSHRKLVDFFINGVSFDQKVAKSPTDEFIEDVGENWKTYAINHPETVAEYLYKHQNKERFGADSRLLVVYLDQDVSFERIVEIIQETNLEMPLNVTFTHKSDPNKVYQVNCFVILLYNQI